MRKIFASFFISLDGVVEAPQNWHFPYLNSELKQAVGELMQRQSVMLLGRKTFEEFAGAFANADPGDEFAAQMTRSPKYVVSTTLVAPEWANTTVIDRDVEAQVAALKAMDGADIAVTGSAVLVRSLLRAGLLDELRLFIHPIVVGSGARLFPESEAAIPLTVADSQTFGTGVLSVLYLPAKD